jgi:glycosyltransferase involved in cell wall biosynthesis
MRVSVIIPTYRRLSEILRCLSSIQKQALSECEIIVADNAADANLRGAIDEFNRTARRRAHYVEESNLGLHNARHAGARAAKGDLLVFTDDDATFDPGWLLAYVYAFETHPGMAAAGGPVRPVWETAPPGWLLELIGDSRIFGELSLMEPFDDFRLDCDGFFFGVNMAIRRHVLFEVGGFNPESFAETWLGDGETGLNIKLSSRQMPIGYVPGALVYHHIAYHRMTLGYLLRRWGNQGACDIYTRYHPAVPGLGRLSADIAKTGVRNARLWARTAIRHRGKLDPASLRAQMGSAYSLRQMWYLLRLLWDPQLRRLLARQRWIDALCEQG